MSYARFAKDSDVYVFLSVRGNLECCGCRLGDDPTFDTTDALLDHLREHVNAGHAVPWRAVLRLEENREENDAWMAEERSAPVLSDGETPRHDPAAVAADKQKEAL